MTSLVVPKSNTARFLNLKMEMVKDPPPGPKMVDFVVEAEKELEDVNYSAAPACCCGTDSDYVAITPGELIEHLRMKQIPSSIKVKGSCNYRHEYVVAHTNEHVTLSHNFDMVQVGLMHDFHFEMKDVAEPLWVKIENDLYLDQQTFNVVTNKMKEIQHKLENPDGLLIFVSNVLIEAKPNLEEAKPLLISNVPIPEGKLTCCCYTKSKEMPTKTKRMVRKIYLSMGNPSSNATWCRIPYRVHKLL